MPSTRIFIGNLSLDVQENDIRERFSSFGIINSIDIKNKLDIEENPISRFAYINLEGDANKCVKSGNGSQLKGSVLKVEIAKESFLDRLKREREQAKQPQNICLDNRGNNEVSFNYDFEKPDQSKYHKKEFNNSSHNSYNSSNFNKYENFHSKYDCTYTDSDHDSELYNHRNYNENRNYGIGAEDKGFNEFSSYKRYYPTDTEDVKKVKTTKEESKMEYSEPKKTFVNIYSKLSFREEASDFSLLKKFSTGKNGEERTPGSNESKKEKLEHANSSTNKVNNNKVIKQKSRNFFVSPDDPLFQGAVEWILTPLTEENEKEFYAAKAELLEVAKLRSSRAKRENSLRSRKAVLNKSKRNFKSQ